MDPISRFGRVIVAMRTRAAASTPAASATVPRAPLPQQERLRRELSLRLAPFALDTPEGRRQAVRAFLQTVLVAELGDALTQSPRFVAMLGEIHETLEADAAVHADLLALLAELKAEGSAP